MINAMHITFRAFITIALALLSCNAAYAQELEYIPMQGYNYRWTVGMDVSIERLEAQKPYDKIMFSTRKGMAIWVAYRFLSPWGVEFGYHWTDDKSKNIETHVGTKLFGAVSQTDANYIGKIREEDSYLDFYYHIPYTIWTKKTEVKLGVGAGWVRENIRFYGIEGSSDPLAIALDNMQNTTMWVARFTLGLQTLIGRQWGVRALLNYQTTSSVKITGVYPGVNQHPFGNTYMIAFGLFYNFNGFYWEKEPNW